MYTSKNEKVMRCSFHLHTYTIKLQRTYPDDNTVSYPFQKRTSFFLSKPIPLSGPWIWFYLYCKSEKNREEKNYTLRKEGKESYLLLISILVLFCLRRTRKIDKIVKFGK